MDRTEPVKAPAFRTTTGRKAHLAPSMYHVGARRADDEVESMGSSPKLEGARAMAKIAARLPGYSEILIVKPSPFDDEDDYIETV